MCKTITEKMNKIRKEIAEINSVKFMSGISYLKCVELNQKLSSLSNKYCFLKYMLEKK